LDSTELVLCPAVRVFITVMNLRLVQILRNILTSCINVHC